MKKLSKPIATLVFCCLYGLLPAQQAPALSLAQLRESAGGSQVLQFLSTVNEGGSKSEDAIRQLFTQALIDKRGLARLADILSSIHENDAPLALYEAAQAGPFEYQLKLLSAEGNWLDATLYLGDSPPHLINGLAIDMTLEPASAAAPIWPESANEKTQASPLTPATPAELARKAQEIAQAYADMGWFSGAVLLAKDGKPFYEEAFGYADDTRKLANTMATRFRIGSINKDYTATLILQQVQQGVLSLDDKLARFGLGFPDSIAQKITIRHLLNHSSGFQDIFIPEYLDNIRSYKDINDILPLLREKPLLFEPGADQAYSNYGYIVLGAILEKTMGKPFRQLLQEQILGPIGASSTYYDIAENIEGEAQSYRFTLSSEREDYTARLEYPTPDGGMYASCADLLSFFHALFYTNTLLNDDMKALLINDFLPGGPSWAEALAHPGSGSGYAGGGPGVSAVVELYFHEGYTLIVLANTDRMVAEHISRRLRLALAGRPAPEAQLPVENYLYPYLKAQGGAYLEENINRLMEKGGYGELEPAMLNRMGYELMEEGLLDQAITVFQANTRLFPQEANGYDSLGEAYLKAGDREKALENYRKALALDPELPSARQMVEELKY